MRYMTSQGKAQALEHWERAKRDRAFAPPTGFVGGHGYPDPEIYGWVDKLNQLSRVCTLQSCAGHVCTLESHCESCADSGQLHYSNGAHVWSGQLWLWLDEPLARYVYIFAGELAMLQGIEKVGLLWHVEGREILDVVFRGAGTGELETSMRDLLVFLREGNRLCNLGIPNAPHL